MNEQINQHTLSAELKQRMYPRQYAFYFHKQNILHNFTFQFVE